MKRKIEYKWIALSVTTIGALMSAIDGTIVVLALPQMMQRLGASLVEMVWVIMAYILVSTVLLFTFGRIADMFGRTKLYNLGSVIFTLGSALCGLSRSATQLILSRLVQGSGAALMMVNSAAIITEVFPPDERGRALGINGITWALGGIAGPLLGGSHPVPGELALDLLHQRPHRDTRQLLGLLRPQGAGAAGRAPALDASGRRPSAWASSPSSSPSPRHVSSDSAAWPIPRAVPRSSPQCPAAFCRPGRRGPPAPVLDLSLVGDPRLQLLRPREAMLQSLAMFRSTSS